MFEPSYEFDWEEYVENQRIKQREETNAYLDTILGKGLGNAFGEVLAFAYLEMPDQSEKILNALNLSERAILCYAGKYNESMFNDIIDRECRDEW